eukprot:2821679-Pleurochrysis_carterae.AAC.2
MFSARKAENDGAFPAAHRRSVKEPARGSGHPAAAANAVGISKPGADSDTLARCPSTLQQSGGAASRRAHRAFFLSNAYAAFWGAGDHVSMLVKEVHRFSQRVQFSNSSYDQSARRRGSSEARVEVPRVHVHQAYAPLPIW